MADVSAVTSHFAVHKEGFITTTSGIVLSGAVTVPLNSVSGLTNGDVFVGLIEPGLSTEQCFTGIVNTAGVQITGVKWTKGTNVDHATGVTVVDYVTSTSQNMRTKGALVIQNQDGTLKTGVVLVTPKVTTSINDANGNEVIRTPATASAVNDVTVTNSATGLPPKMAASGDDTNINYLLDGKGTGLVIPRFAAPQGYLVNGKIVTSVASNNLTVAINTLDGNTPSATNPVFVRIGNTIRSITAALSVTKNAGTNWFNSGSTALAAQEIDYFVYIGYNATDGVVIGFSRISHARVYGDFSATTTNDRYCAISVITNATSTDEYEVVGRFNATLSATAAFNWSIPATSIILNYPVWESRLLAYTASVVSVAGTLTTVSADANYRVLRGRCRLQTTVTITTNGTGATGLNIGIPLTSSAKQTTFASRETAIIGLLGAITIVGSATVCILVRYDNTYLGGNGYVIPITGDYEL